MLGVGRRITPRNRRKTLLTDENAKKIVLDGKKKRIREWDMIPSFIHKANVVCLIKIKNITISTTFFQSQ